LLLRLLETTAGNELTISDTAASTVIFFVMAFDSACLMALNATFCLLPLGSGFENKIEWSRSIVQEVISSPSLSIPRVCFSSLNPKLLPSSPSLLFSSNQERLSPPITSIFVSRAAFRLE
jgi:hypothetical protein